jgi:hypothetical protein
VSSVIQAIALLAAAGFLGIAVFQVALALGAPLGHAAWGGANRVIPARLRRASAVAAVVWLLAAVLVLGRGGVLDLPLPEIVVIGGAWALVVLSALGALVNLASSSRWERYGWAPYAAVLAVLSLVVALSPT